MWIYVCWDSGRARRKLKSSRLGPANLMWICVCSAWAGLGENWSVQDLAKQFWCESMFAGLRAGLGENWSVQDLAKQTWCESVFAWPGTGLGENWSLQYLAQQTLLGFGPARRSSDKTKILETWLSKLDLVSASTAFCDLNRKDIFDQEPLFKS